jgi:hypothetical protein
MRTEAMKKFAWSIAVVPILVAIHMLSNPANAGRFGNVNRHPISSPITTYVNKTSEGTETGANTDCGGCQWVRFVRVCENNCEGFEAMRLICPPGGTPPNGQNFETSPFSIDTNELFGSAVCETGFTISYVVNGPDDLHPKICNSLLGNTEVETPADACPSTPLSIDSLPSPQPIGRILASAENLNFDGVDFPRQSSKLTYNLQSDLSTGDFLFIGSQDLTVRVGESNMSPENEVNVKLTAFAPNGQTSTAKLQFFCFKKVRITDLFPDLKQGTEDIVIEAISQSRNDCACAPDNKGAVKSLFGALDESLGSARALSVAGENNDDVVTTFKVISGKCDKTQSCW